MESKVFHEAMQEAGRRSWAKRVSGLTREEISERMRKLRYCRPRKIKDTKKVFDLSEKGLSNRQIADMCKVSISTIYRILNKKNES